MPTKSLQARKNLLSDPQEQLKYLSNGIFGSGELPLFREKIAATGDLPLKPKKLE
ncbi:radical SAM protein, partial [Salinimicrobium sp. CDJ15-91]|nr:radical SAM protein [Salinimicrobium oceani]